MKKLITLFCIFACIIFGSSCTVTYDPYFPGIYSRDYAGCRSGFPVYHSYHYVPNTYCRPTYYHNSPYYK